MGSGKRFTQLVHYMDMDFLKENPGIYLTVGGRGNHPPPAAKGRSGGCTERGVGQIRLTDISQCISAFGFRTQLKLGINQHLVFIRFFVVLHNN